MNLYVGTTRVERTGPDIQYGPKGSIGLVEVPDDVQVIGMYEVQGALYVEWVAEV